MSTWTSSTLLLAAALIIAGCGGGGISLPGGSANAPANVSVTSDMIVVTGPAGFCVDPASTRDQGDTAFVLLGNCAAIANSRDAPQPAVPALLTAAISAAGLGGEISANIPDLDTFFRSPEGRRLLSRTQDAVTVEVLATATEGDVFYLQARDTSDGPVDGVQRDYWRAYLDIGSRIATLSVLGLEDREVSDAQSRATLRQFVDALRAANAPGTAVVAPRPPGSLATGGPIWNIGLFRRIFG